MVLNDKLVSKKYIPTNTLTHWMAFLSKDVAVTIVLKLHLQVRQHYYTKD